MLEFTLLVIGLDFDEVEGLFLAERACGLVGVFPIANGEGRSGTFGAENFPVVGNANRDFRLGAGSVNFGEPSSGIDVGALDKDAGDGFDFFNLPRLGFDQVIIIAD